MDRNLVADGCAATWRAVKISAHLAAKMEAIRYCVIDAGDLPQTRIEASLTPMSSRQAAP